MIIVIDNENSWSLRRGADARRRIILYCQTQVKSACRESDLSLSGLDPVPLSKIGTRLLASLGSKGKNRNPVACLRNAGSYSAVTYCIRQETSRRSDPRQTTGRQNRLCTISIRVEKNL